MKRLKTVLLIYIALFCCLGAAWANKPKVLDVNQDGKPDVFYHHDGESITKINADTNYDGTDDVIVYIEDGKFNKAHIDADHDGEYEVKIDNEAQFKNWVNENRPDFNDSLAWDDYSRKISKVFWKPGQRD
ncbi:MAG: hypothetical protein BWY16_00562 [Candidatus Omnitrophica bacterium ADurb.Bin205]|nr:MAG: hypothetical protein BWY16_00562 [Candidatus Omnitrophica bacterium ADurb.Bin205]